MKYSRVFVDAIGYELAPVVVGSDELEARLAPVYDALRIRPGQLESLTGIVERRWWDEGYPLSAGAAAAAQHALEAADLRPDQVEVLVYGGVCRELFEPATACRVAAEVGVGPDTAIHDVSNACLGAINGMVDVANRIELGQIRAGLVVSCETAREINDIAIARMNEAPTMANYREGLATLTGGSGAVAIVLSDGSFANRNRRRLLGGVTKAAPEFHALCRWGMERLGPGAANFAQFMATDSVSVLKHGVELGRKTWDALLARMGWAAGMVDRVICHQVGSGHRDTVLASLGIDPARDFSTFPHLGNIGTVSVPLTAAVAEERDFLQPGDRVGWLGIGSGLNCMMLGFEW